MSSILLVTCNSETTTGNLRRSAADVIHALRQWDHGCMVRERHLYRGAVPKFDSNVAASLAISPQARTEAQWKTVALSELLLSEVRASDFLVIAARLDQDSLPPEILDWSEHMGHAAAVDAVERKIHPWHNKIAIVVAERPIGNAERSPNGVCESLRASLAQAGVAEVALMEADPDGYPLRAAPIMLLVARHESAAHPLRL